MSTPTDNLKPKAGGGCLERLVRRFQVSIPCGHRRKLALGFFMIDPPCEWGLRCIWYDGPNHYLALGRLCFGWGFVNTPNIVLGNETTDSNKRK